MPCIIYPSTSQPSKHKKKYKNGEGGYIYLWGVGFLEGTKMKERVTRYILSSNRCINTTGAEHKSAIPNPYNSYINTCPKAHKRESYIEVIIRKP